LATELSKSVSSAVDDQWYLKTFEFVSSNLNQSKAFIILPLNELGSNGFLHHNYEAARTSLSLILDFLLLKYQHVWRQYLFI
jgi:hypothetical protein